MNYKTLFFMLLSYLSTLLSIFFDINNILMFAIYMVSIFLITFTYKYPNTPIKNRKVKHFGYLLFSGICWATIILVFQPMYIDGILDKMMITMVGIIPSFFFYK